MLGTMRCCALWTSLPRSSAGCWTASRFPCFCLKMTLPCKQHDCNTYCSNKKLLGAPGIATRSKDATRGSWAYYLEQEAISLRFSNPFLCSKSSWAVGDVPLWALWLQTTTLGRQTDECPQGHSWTLAVARILVGKRSSFFDLFLAIG